MGEALPFGGGGRHSGPRLCIPTSRIRGYFAVPLIVMEAPSCGRSIIPKTFCGATCFTWVHLPWAQGEARMLVWSNQRRTSFSRKRGTVRTSPGPRCIARRFPINAAVAIPAEATTPIPTMIACTALGRILAIAVATTGLCSMATPSGCAYPKRWFKRSHLQAAIPIGGTSAKRPCGIERRAIRTMGLIRRGMVGQQT